MRGGADEVADVRNRRASTFLRINPLEDHHYCIVFDASHALGIE